MSVQVSSVQKPLTIATIKWKNIVELKENKQTKTLSKLQVY